MLSDFNCRLFELNRFEIFDADRDGLLSIELEKIKKDIASLSKCGFHTFYCPIRYNDNFSVSHTLQITRKLREISRNAIPRDCGKIAVYFVPRICVSPDVPYIKNISSLCVKKTNYIFVELPLDLTPTYIPETLNKLLYSCHLKPIFSEFQLYVEIYDPSEIKKMLRIKGAAFQFNIKTAFEPQNIAIIKRIIKNGNYVLLGTNSNHDNLNINDVNINLRKLKNTLGEHAFLEIIINSKRFLS